jgi:intracellular sulfur oxidation DsrE/DsrF family protein
MLKLMKYPFKCYIAKANIKKYMLPKGNFHKLIYMKKTLVSVLVSIVFLSAAAQAPVQDSVTKAKAKADSIKWAKMEARLVFPLINAGTFSGVIPVSNPTEIPNPNMSYKLLFELVVNNKDSAVKEINHGLTEICRIINLHVASGIPVKNIIPVIVVHGPALFSFYTNDNYKKKYKIDNPNIAVAEELIRKTGAKFIACGQAMNFLEVPQEAMIPQMKVSLTAQTVLSGYQLKGYKLFEITEDKL